MSTEERVLAGGIDTSRQDMLILDTSARILIIGGGATGSTVAAMLSKMGFSGIQVWDDATLEEENLGGGVFDSTFIGKPKVESIASMCKILTGQDAIVPVLSRFDPEAEGFQCPEIDIVIVGVDTLEMRRTLLTHLDKIDTELYIDARMGGTGCSSLAVRVLDPTDVEWYRPYVFNIEDAELMCGEKSTAYVVFALASMVGNAVRAYVNEQAMPRYQMAVVDEDIRLVSFRGNSR